MSWDTLRPTLSLAFEQAKRDAIVLMQFTGLKDKNGKEIYEGDILCRAGHRNRVVEWKEDAFILRPNPALDSDHDQPYRLKTVTRTSEVIGNIYENPELLR